MSVTCLDENYPSVNKIVSISKFTFAHQDLLKLTLSKPLITLESKIIKCLKKLGLFVSIELT